MYQSLARWCYHHRWTVVGVWLALIVGLNAAGGAVGSAFDAEFTSTGSESNAGFETLEE
jgi:RND superfamily putative drug exporter